MIHIDTHAFRRMVGPIPNGDTKMFIHGLAEAYGIIHMIPVTPGEITTDWLVIFVDDKAELMFRLKHGEML